MREFDRDLIRGGHYGQRSHEPRQKAGHMAAPTNAAKREESPCQPGAVHTWHETDMPMQSPHVGCWGINGPGWGRGSKSDSDRVHQCVRSDHRCPPKKVLLEFKKVT